MKKVKEGKEKKKAKESHWMNLRRRKWHLETNDMKSLTGQIKIALRTRKEERKEKEKQSP